MIDGQIYFTGGGSTPIDKLNMTSADMKRHMVMGGVFGIDTPDGSTWLINPANLAAVHIQREYDAPGEDE